MLVLMIKLLLVPALLAAVTLGARRWGSAVGGWMGGFPIVVGPILLVTTLEQGAGFGVSAAQAALLTIGPTALFLLIFAHLSLNRPWWQSALPAYAGWGLVVGLISLFPLRSDLAAGSAVAGLLLAEIFMPTIPPRVPVEQKKTHPGGLAAKMVVGVFLIFVTTAVASAMGPRVAGYAAAFPLILSVSAMFTHAWDGRDSLLRLLLGFRRGLWSIVLFCLVLLALLPKNSVGLAFSGAVIATIALHTTLLPRVKPRLTAPRG